MIEGDRLRRAAPFLLLAWVALNFGWTLAFGFTNDDFMWISGAALDGRRGWSGLVFNPFWQSFVRPLVQLSFVANFALSGLEPFTYHLFNVGLHAANTLLLCSIAALLRLPPAAALVAALAFAVHPTRVDAVAWVSGRTELLCATFYLAAVAAHLRRRRSWALGFFALSLLSKETAVSLPLVVLALEMLQPAPGGRQPWRALPYFAVLAIYLVARVFMVTNFAAGLVQPEQALSLHPNVLSGVRGRVTRIGEFLFAPLPLHGFLRSLLALAAGTAAALAWVWRRRTDEQRAGAFALAWIGLTLAPYTIWLWISPWYVYLPSAGAALLIVAAGGAALATLSPRWRIAVAAAALFFWLGASMVQLQAGNARERRAGLVTARVLDQIAAALPAPRPGTVVGVSGIRSLTLSGSPWAPRPVLFAGLPQAVQLRFGQPRLDVRLVDDDAAARRAFAARHAARPVVFLHWRGLDEGFVRRGGS